MITLSLFKSAVIESGRRILKVAQFGAKTAYECAPFGVDSQPLEGATAVFAETSNRAEPVILGYIQRNQQAKAGETRFFALDGDGNTVTELYLGDDGVLTISKGIESAVQFEPLDNGLQASIALLNAELTKIQTGLVAVGGVYAKQDVTLNISQAEQANVKL